MGFQVESDEDDIKLSEIDADTIFYNKQIPKPP